VDSLQIGMAQDARAYKIGKISAKPLLIWLMTLISYEACPYYSGAFMIASYRQNNGYIHFPLGKIYDAADPPSFMSERLFSKVAGSIVNISSTITSDDDMDTRGQEIEKSILKIKLDSTLMILEQRTWKTDSLKSS
jgi:hypothetical protein